MINIQQHLLIAGALSIILSACAHLPANTDLSSKVWPAAPAKLGQGFDGAGRLAIKDYGKGSYANFSWQNLGSIQTIEVKTPLGNSVGNLCRDQQGVIAQDRHGQIIMADNINELSQRLLGFSLPFEYLNQWVQGYRLNHTAYEIQSENRLYQLGWRIRRQLQADGQTPKLIQLTNQRFDIKLLFDDYKPTNINDNGHCPLRQQFSATQQTAIEANTSPMPPNDI